MSLPPPPPPPPPGPPAGSPADPWSAFPRANVPAGQLAGFWARFVGYLLDGLLYGLLAAAFVIPGGALMGYAFADCETVDYSDGTSELLCADGDINVGAVLGGLALIVVGLIVVFVLYIRALGRTGQTWGRKIAGVKVVRQDDGQPIGVGKAFGRQLFAGVISANIFYLGYLWMLWDDRKQTWHDKIVGSIVVKA